MFLVAWIVLDAWTDSPYAVYSFYSRNDLLEYSVSWWSMPIKSSTSLDYSGLRDRERGESFALLNTWGLEEEDADMCTTDFW